MNADERRFFAGNSGFKLSSQFVDTTLAKMVRVYIEYRRAKGKLRSSGSWAARQQAMFDAYIRGDYEDALEIARGLFDDFFTGNLLMQLGRFAEAEQLLRRAVSHEKEPRLAALANTVLGQLLMRQQNYERAQECFEAALRLWPDRGSTHRDMAEVWLRRGGSPAEALRWARLAVEKERAGEGVSADTKRTNLSEDLATLAWAVAADSGDAAEVERLCAEAVGLCGTDPVTLTAQVHCHCGLAYTALRDEVKKVRHFEEAVRVDPNGVWGREARSMAVGNQRLKAAADFSGATDWGGLQHAFGAASDLPDLLAAISKATGTRFESRMGELYERVLHQGTIYSASPPAVHALIGMSVGAAPSEKKIFYDMLSEFSSSARKAIRDGRAIPCCSGGEPADGAAILQELLQARSQFTPDLQHTEAAIRGFAGVLLTPSADTDAAAAQLVRARYMVEVVPAVRLQWLDGLIRVSGAFTDWREFLDTALRTERDAANRFTLRYAEMREMGPDAEPTAVEDLATSFLETHASDFAAEGERFFEAVHLLGREREFAALMRAFDGAGGRHLARILAERLLRLAFEDKRTGWGQTSYSYTLKSESEGGEAPAKAGRRAHPGVFAPMVKMLFKVLGQIMLWKLFPFLKRRQLRKMAQPYQDRIEKIDYLGIKGAMPEIPAKLTAEQRSVLRSFADKAVLWEFRTNLWELFGLPASGEEIRSYVIGRV
jgi:tetratricopeptide (TPR) repeat protein